MKVVKGCIYPRKFVNSLKYEICHVLKVCKKGTKKGTKRDQKVTKEGPKRDQRGTNEGPNEGPKRDQR